MRRGAGDITKLPLAKKLAAGLTSEGMQANKGRKGEYQRKKGKFRKLRGMEAAPASVSGYVRG